MSILSKRPIRDYDDDDVESRKRTVNQVELVEQSNILHGLLQANLEGGGGMN